MSAPQSRSLQRREGGGTVVVLGAASAIARAIALEFAERGYDLLLAGRDTEELEKIATDASVRRGVGARALAFGALQPETHAAFLQSCREASNDSLTGAVLCFGALGDQAEAEADAAEARRIVDTNFTGAVSILGHFANHLEEKRSG